MSMLDEISKKSLLSPADLDEIETEFDPKHIVWRLTAEIRRLAGFNPTECERCSLDSKCDHGDSDGFATATGPCLNFALKE